MSEAHKMIERVAAERGIDTQDYIDALVSGPLTGMTKTEMMVAFGDIHRTGLDPLSEEILFLKKGGKVTASIRYSGMTKLMRRAGITQVDVTYTDLEGGDIECRAVLGKTGEDGVTESFCRPEYLSECRQNTGPWKQYPRKMLGHRAVMQTARLACDINLPSADEYLEVGYKKQEEPDEEKEDDGFRIIGGGTQ